MISDTVVPAMKDYPSAITRWSLVVGVRPDIGVQNVHKILFGEEKGQSHKASRSYNRGSFVAGTTVHIMQLKKERESLTSSKSDFQSISRLN